MTANELSGTQLMGFQYSFVDKIKGRMEEMPSFNKLVVRARTTNASPLKAKVSLICNDASSVSSFITLTTDFQEIEIPLKSFTFNSTLLMPRPYPGFLPLVFKGSGAEGKLDLINVEKIEMTIGSDIPSSDLNRPYNLDVECVWLTK